MFLILEAAAETGVGSMKRRQNLLINRIDEIKQDMFNKSKMKMLKKLNNLKVLISYSLKTIMWPI